MPDNRLRYKCTACGKEKAVLRSIFVTKTLKFRCKFHCPMCNNNFEVSINGKNWGELNYNTKEIAMKIIIISYKLLEEARKMGGIK